MASVAVTAGLGALASAGGGAALGLTGSQLFLAGLAGAGAGAQIGTIQDQKEFAQQQSRLASAAEQGKIARAERDELANLEQSQAQMRAFYSAMGIDASSGTARLVQQSAQDRASQRFGDFRSQARLMRIGRSLGDAERQSRLTGQQFGKLFDSAASIGGAIK